MQNLIDLITAIQSLNNTQLLFILIMALIALAAYGLKVMSKCYRSQRKSQQQSISSSSSTDPAESQRSVLALCWAVLVRQHTKTKK